MTQTTFSSPLSSLSKVAITIKGGQDVPVEEDTMHRRERRWSPSRRRYHNRLSGAVSAVDTCLYELAKLGRSGQWILHHEDLYHATHDTRPHSRHLDKEVPIKGLTYHGAPIKDWGMIWAGKGPTPDFTNVAFWETKRDELEKKLEQVKAGLVQPRFTSKELQTLESLELQVGHFFHTHLSKRKTEMVNNKRVVLRSLFDLAALERPGQWVLHHEELYHPVIDTRPQTRTAETSVVIRDSTFRGDTRVLGDGILYDYELTWAGNGPQPDFTDFLYWRNKASELLNKTHQVEDGLVQPNFTPEELRELEAMERNQDHYFGQCARREKPSVVDTPESRAASAELRSAKVMVQALLMSLWTDGYPGQWVLYHQNLYIPEIDIRSRDRDRDEDDTERHVLIPGLDGMCYDGDGPLPDFEDIAYWEEKKAELQKKRAEIAAGKIEHHFTRGELMRIELVESAAMERHRRIGEAHRYKTGGGADQVTSSIDAWLGTNPGEGRPPSPPPPPPPPPTLQGHVRQGAKKRKRSMADDNEALLGIAKRPVKHSTEQAQPGAESPTAAQRQVSRQQHVLPPQKSRGRSRTAAPASMDSSSTRMKADGRRLDTQRLTTDFVQGGSKNAKRQVQRLASAGQHMSRQDDLPANLPLRRSARVAALPPRSYR